jgi:hypothetical protein
MPDKKREPEQKPDTELTTEEVIQKLFPKEVIEYAKKVAHEKDKPNESTQEE